MKKCDVIEEYKYYYESYVYYDVVKKDSKFAEINLAKCNLLADLLIRYYDGSFTELELISKNVNEKIKNKYL